MSYEVFADFYDALTDNVDYAVLSKTICSLLARYGLNRGLLLDLGCGTGTLSVLLSKAGYEVVGADISPDMLAVAQEKAFAAGQDILFLCQDMTRLDLYGTLDAAVCTLDALNHLPSRAAVEETLRRVSLFLNPGGVFIFDANTLYKHREVLGNNTFVYDTDAVYCVWQNELQTDEKTVEISLDFFIPASDDEPIYERESEQFTECAYSGAEWDEMLRNAGFSVLGVFDGYSENPLTDTSERAVYAVRKD
ncbi:MAG: class I SAM-dependent methyltransferase [Clostridia bacterium]|nr:class I SAM-dependent methyltransferase [Clostridia bacterium]